jgi:transcriptional regulator with XRE-family HTH domain
LTDSPTPEAASVVERITVERKRQGLSLRALGTASGVAFSTLARVERGEGSYDAESERKLRAWLGEDVGHVLSADQIRAAEDLGRAIARACSDEIMAIVRTSLKDTPDAR